MLFFNFFLKLACYLCFRFSEKAQNKKEVRMNIYVGNLSYDVTEDDLRQAFEGFGQVASATIIMDKFTGKSRGFGFVEMPIEDEAKSAITGMNGKELKGRTLTVNEARPRSERGRGGGRGVGGGGYRGGYGGSGRRDVRRDGGGREDRRGGGRSRGGGRRSR